MCRSYPCLIAIFLVGFFYPYARGEFVFDDFDDSAETVSPEMEGIGVVTQNVGFLGAERTIEIDALGADPICHLDSNITEPSLLTAQLVDLVVVGSDPVAAMQLWYSNFGIADFTQGDANDSLLFDFASITGANSPAFLRITVNEGSGASFVNYITDLPLTEEPFTLVVQFDSFVRRDGVPDIPSFSTILYFWVEFYSNGYWGAPIENGWTVSLDAIRVGRAVPEPSSFLICGTTIIYLGVFLAKRSIYCHSGWWHWAGSACHRNCLAAHY